MVLPDKSRIDIDNLVVTVNLDTGAACQSYIGQRAWQRTGYKLVRSYNPDIASGSTQGGRSKGDFQNIANGI
jgi:hypothetical protein